MSHRPLIVLLSSATLMATVLAACGDDGGASVSLDAPAAGAKIAGAVPLKMSADGLTIEAAGTAVKGHGHFHVIADAGCAATGATIAKDADHVHFGKGQTEGFIYLEPGTHELCLQAGDGVHAALDATDQVKVDVGITSQAQWCTVIKALDDLFASTDNADTDFAAKQAAYVNARRLVHQLVAGLPSIDQAARPDVAETLTFAEALTTAVATATDAAAAEAATTPIFEQYSQPVLLPGSTWILDQCQVNING